jgi:SRSO17 transposase
MLTWHTKGELAKAMLARAFAVQVPVAWVTGDEIYGHDGKLRRWLQEEQHPYVLAVARSHMDWHHWVPVRVEARLAEMPPDAWARIAVAPGRTGPRVPAARGRSPPAGGAWGASRTLSDR